MNIRHALIALAASTMLVLTPAPAHAALTDQENKELGTILNPKYVSTTVHYREQADGRGYVVWKIEIDCWPRGDFEDDTQVRTDALALYVRNGGEKRWSQPDGNITSGCHREWHPDVRLPEKGGSIYWNGEAKLTWPAADQGFGFWNDGPYNGVHRTTIR